jgi:type III restriction enzyme
MAQERIPIQPVPKPIICSPYDEPDRHWDYDKDTGEARNVPGRRDAGYWYKTDRVGAAQQSLFDEERDDLPLINALRKDVRRWRQAKYRGASNITKELLNYWSRQDRFRKLFFCQREAVETIIYLAELRCTGRSSKTEFKQFAITDDDIRKMLAGDRPAFYITPTDFFPTFIDASLNPGSLPLRRLGCKMATGSGKTVAMAMLIAWTFCNRAMNPYSAEFPNAVLVACPNLTVKERLQVLRPEDPANYYAEFDIVPLKYRPLLQKGKVLVTNWHLFNPRSEHEEGGRSYAVVNKGPDTPETFSRYVLGDMFERMPIMVLNDEGHHCWRPANHGNDSAEDVKALEQETEEATVWIEGLDRLNQAGPHGKPGIGLCVDMSATPFYIGGSGHPEGRPFPWLISDFGLVDAIESGIVKIPRLPVSDTTGLPDPKYFRLWERIRQDLAPGEFSRSGGRKPKPEAVYRESEGALQQLAQHWKERFSYIQNATPGQDHIPPVMIIVCDNTEIAELFYTKVSGETQVEQVISSDLEDTDDSEEGDETEQGNSRRAKAKMKTVYGPSAVLPEFANTVDRKHTIRIDTKLLAEAESEDGSKAKRELGEELRKVVATVGKPGKPGEHVRCVVSVAMLTEGWDANNVTHILGLRAFGSQLLCEQVVGRGLRRTDYTPIKTDDGKELLTEEYVDVYGIPFSVIPFKGRPAKKKAEEDKPKSHVRALPERKSLEIRFPNVESYTFALRKNIIRCDVDSMESLVIEPHREPTATFFSPTVGYQHGNRIDGNSPIPTAVQDRHAYYEQNHIQTIKFQIARLIVQALAEIADSGRDARARVFRLQSRHYLFPQIYAVVEEYVFKKVNFREENPSELGLEKYVTRIVERLLDRIEPDDFQGEPPLMPILNRYNPFGSTADVDFFTVKSCFATRFSHVNQVGADTELWEQSAAFRLECAATEGTVLAYAKNDRLGLAIPNEYLEADHSYEPDFLVRLQNGLTVLLEMKEQKWQEDNQSRAKHDAAKRWVSAVNNWRQLGIWVFHVCYDPQLLETELRRINSGPIEPQISV